MAGKGATQRSWNDQLRNDWHLIAEHGPDQLLFRSVHFVAYWPHVGTPLPQAVVT